MFNFDKITNKMVNLFHNRNKRGLINGLGSIIKSITGNLDSQDAERYDEIFRKIEENQKILEKQNFENINLNKRMIEKFDKQIKNINHNELVLKSRIIQTEQLLKEQITHENLFRTKDIINQITFILINLLEIISEIETSLTFCNINKLHSSIMNINELREIIKDTKSNLNFWEIAIQVTSHCQINKEQIKYLIEIPIYENNDENLLQITPIPLIIENEIYLINENKELLIKKDQNLYYTQQCININHAFHCKTNFVEVKDCLSNVIIKQNNNYCEYHKLKRAYGIFEIENSNVYYIVTSEFKDINIKCKNFEIRKRLKGIYKTNLETDCKVNNYAIETKVINSKEIIFENMNIQIGEVKLTNENLNLEPIDNQNIIIPELPSTKNVIVSHGHNITNTVLIIIIVLFIIIVIIIKFYKYYYNYDVKENNDAIELQDLREQL